jgi:hypothetical protein
VERINVEALAEQNIPKELFPDFVWKIPQFPRDKFPDSLRLPRFLHSNDWGLYNDFISSLELTGEQETAITYTISCLIRPFLSGVDFPIEHPGTIGEARELVKSEIFDYLRGFDRDFVYREIARRLFGVSPFQKLHQI